MPPNDGWAEADDPRYLNGLAPEKRKKVEAHLKRRTSAVSTARREAGR